MILDFNVYFGTRGGKVVKVIMRKTKEGRKHVYTKRKTIFVFLLFSYHFSLFRQRLLGNRLRPSFPLNRRHVHNSSFCLSGMERLQAEVESGRLWRCRHPSCTIGTHMVTRHCSLQQVSWHFIRRWAILPLSHRYVLLSRLLTDGIIRQYRSRSAWFLLSRIILVCHRETAILHRILACTPVKLRSRYFLWHVPPPGILKSHVAKTSGRDCSITGSTSLSNIEK